MKNRLYTVNFREDWKEIYLDILHSRLRLFLTLSSVCLAILATYFHGFNLDYNAYIIQWEHIRLGENPWIGLHENIANTYGPAHVFMAYIAGINNFIPKYIFTLLWLVQGHLLLKYATSKGFDSSDRWSLLQYWLFCPFFWRLTVDRGFNDSLVAASFFLAYLLNKKEKKFLLSFCLTVGILTKFIPLIILPFYCVKPEFLRKNNWIKAIDFRLLFISVISIIFIFCLCYGIWSESVFLPIYKASQRPSKILSVFRYLRGEYSFLHLFYEHPNLDSFSFPSLILCLFFLWIFYLSKACYADRNLYVFTALLITLAFYKVGHSQFFAPVFFLCPLIWLDYGRENNFKPVFKVGVYLLFWITFQDLMYSITGGFKHFPGSYFRELGGLLSFILISYLLMNLLNFILNKKNDVFMVASD